MTEQEKESIVSQWDPLIAEGSGLKRCAKFMVACLRTVPGSLSKEAADFLQAADGYWDDQPETKTSSEALANARSRCSGLMDKRGHPLDLVATYQVLLDSTEEGREDEALLYFLDARSGMGASYEEINSLSRQHLAQ